MSCNQDKCVCEYNDFQRPRYFHGMLLDDKDFLAEQGYHSKKRRFLNRMLHGSGVVCGLDLNGEKGGKWLELTAGLAFDCCGNEIWVGKSRRLDLAQLLPPKKALPGGAECQEPDNDDDKLTKHYIGIRYVERATDPVSVYLPGAGCEERTCENSRVKEGYCVEVVKCCPKKYPDNYPPTLLKSLCECKDEPESDNADEGQKNGPARCGTCGDFTGKKKCQCDHLENFSEQSLPCPECGNCDEPCHVILGEISLDKEGRLQNICINECRDYVLTGRMVQHLILSTFTGVEKNMKFEDNRPFGTTASELAYNPIKALYWFLRNFVMQEGGLDFIECPGLTAAQGRTTPSEELEQRLAEERVRFAAQLKKSEETIKKQNEVAIRKLSQSIEEVKRQPPQPQ